MDMKTTGLSYLIIELAIALIPFSAIAANPTAESLLSALRTKVANSPSVEAVFTINGGGGAVEGSVILSGNKYTMTTPQVAVWYDGRTQWTLLEASQEVSITEPTTDEVMTSNPFAILTAHRDFYTSRLLNDIASRKRVELTPRDKSLGISHYIIYINPTTGWPTALKVNFDDGRTIDVVINSISAGKAKSASIFTYDPAKYPAMEVVDLR